jgi:tetratricopeptide (TPR) repeat protein
MVGRAPELASLRDVLEAMCHGRQPHVALVAGEAGLGKSRLVAEFRASLVDLDVSLYQGAGLAHMRSAPLCAVADLLRDILDTSEIDPVQHQQAALDTYVRQRGLSHDGVWPYLSNVLGLGQRDPQAEARLRQLDAAMLQRQTYAALRQVLLAEARHAPTVLVFEDLQWIDPAARDFLEHIIQTTQALNDLPILLILVSRDSERSTVLQSLIAAASKYRDRFLDIRLQALTEVEGAALVDRLIAETTYHATRLKQRIAQRAVGNPFYLEEIIQMLIDQGGLIGDHCPWQVTEQADELLLQVPGTLQGLVMARFDRLPEQLRRVLQKAAVIGRSFPVRLLHALDETHSAIITSQLVELEARQFLIPEPIGPEQGYTFRHGLFQETVYQTLLLSDRQKIHECAARAIERMSFYPADEQVEVLAYHYTESANPDRAVPLLIAAADRAVRRYANEAAIHYYRQAISLMASRLEDYEEQFVPVRVGLGQALTFVGHFAEARQMLREALSHIESLGDDSNARFPWHISCLRELADACHRDGVPDEAIGHLEVGLTLLSHEGSTHHPRLWHSLMDRLAWIRFRQGRLDDGLLLAQAALSDVDPRRVEDPITLASLHNTLGGILWQQGKLLEAVAHVQQSLDLYQMLGYGWGMANAYANLGVLYFTQGAWSHAADSFEHAYALQCEMGYTPAQALSLKNLGLLQMAMGDHTLARQSLESSLAISLQIEDEYGALVAHIGLAHLAITESRFDDASRHIDLAASKPDVAGEDERIQIRWTLALLEAEHDDMAKGIESAKQAIQMAQEARLVELEAECRRVLGMLHRRAGEWVEAEHELQSSAALSAQGKDMYRQGLALHELGSLYEQRSHADTKNCEQWCAAACEAFAGAVDLFEQLGAKYDLRAAQAALEQLRR